MGRRKRDLSQQIIAKSVIIITSEIKIELSFKSKVAGVFWQLQPDFQFMLKLHDSVLFVVYQYIVRYRF